MSRLVFHGEISTGDNSAVCATLQDWMKDTALHVKNRIFGSEITYENDSATFYCYEAMTPPGVDQFFLIEGTISDVKLESDGTLTDLVRCCAIRGLHCTVDYSEVDSDDDPIGDERTVETGPNLSCG